MTSPPLIEVLAGSASLKRALGRMCNTRDFIHPTNGTQTKLFSFKLEKVMDHLAGKYSKIKRHLAMRYVRENRGMILEMRRAQTQRRTVIKQETKSEGVVKTEAVKNENGTLVKSESAAA